MPGRTPDEPKFEWGGVVHLAQRVYGKQHRSVVELLVRTVLPAYSAAAAGCSAASAAAAPFVAAAGFLAAAAAGFLAAAAAGFLAAAAAGFFAAAAAGFLATAAAGFLAAAAAAAALLAAAAAAGLLATARLTVRTLHPSIRSLTRTARHIFREGFASPNRGGAGWLRVFPPTASWPQNRLNSKN